MALTLTLTDGATSLDLIGTTYLAQSLDLGNPSDVRAEVEGLMRDGWDLIAHRFTRRTVTVSLRIDAASQVALDTAIKDVHEALRKARLWAMYDLGNRWRLQFNPGGSASSVYFVVKGGSLSIPAESLHVTQMLKNTNPIVLRAALVLECDPLAEGTEETLSNYFKNAGFELGATASADVTITNGTPVADTADRVEGAQSCAITLAAAAAQFLAYETVTMVGGNHVWHINYKLTGDKSFEAYLSDAGGTSVTALVADGTWRTATVTRDSAANTAITAGVRTTGAVTDVNDVIKLDMVYLGDGTTASTGWVSCRAITNHNDLMAQAHTNYLDVYPPAGDYPAKVQVKASEAQAHTKFWLGARHGTRMLDAGIWHEAEDFATWDSEPADAAASGGAYGRWASGLTALQSISAVATATNSLTIGINPGTLFAGLLIVGITAGKAAGGVAPTGVTHNGDPLTKASEVTNGTVNVSIWYRVAPDATGNVVATWAAAQDALIGIASTYDNVHQTIPLGTPVTATGSSTAATANVPGCGASDTLYAAAGSAGATAGTPSNDLDIELGDSTSGAGYRGLTGTGYDIPATASGQWIDLADAAWAIISVAIKPFNAASPKVFTKAVATPPVGAYRVLARIHGNGGAFGVAMGYTYGGVTQDPSVSTQYVPIAAATTVWHILDIGSIIIPPAPLPSGATIGTLTLRLCVYRTSGSTGHFFYCDWVMLLPVDYGSSYASKASGTDVVVIDTISRSPTLALWNTSDVFQSRPQQEGTPPDVDPDGTRLYLACDDGVDATITDGYNVAVRLIPQFMFVG